MHPRTVATLDQLRNVEWFNHIGVHDTEVAIILHSWEEAIEHCQTEEWQGLLLEASNQYCERLVERSIERFRLWNEVVDNVKPIAFQFVEEKTAEVIRKYSLPPIFKQTVEWDILHLCMEAEYADVYKPGFFAVQGYWYMKGHFPCGWEGNFPKGKRIIF